MSFADIFNIPGIYKAARTVFKEAPSLKAVSRDVSKVARAEAGLAERMLTMGTKGDNSVLAALNKAIGDPNKAQEVYNELKALRPDILIGKGKENFIKFLESDAILGKFEESTDKVLNLLSYLTLSLSFGMTGKLGRSVLATNIIMTAPLLALDMYTITKTASMIGAEGLWPVVGVGAGVGAALGYLSHKIGSPARGILGKMEALESIGKFAQNPIVRTTLVYPTLASYDIDYSNLNKKDNTEGLQISMHNNLQRKKGFQ